MRTNRIAITFTATTLLACAAATAAPRDVQITNVDLTTGIITLHNFGATDEVMNGWRFCSHDTSFVRQYSSVSGFNGKNIGAGTDFFVHWNNGGPNDADNINASNLGGSSADINDSAFAVQLYFAPVNFSNPTTMADAIQWSIGGVNNTVADDRSDEAVTAGLWTDQTLWISTTAASESIELLPASGGMLLHGPDDYAVNEPPGIPGDLNGDGTVDTADLGILIGQFGTAGPGADINGDGMVDTADLGILIGNFGAGG